MRLRCAASNESSRFPVALVLGIGSGAAMIPFSMIKEANRLEFLRRSRTLAG